MTSTIVFVTDFPDAATAAQEITPSGFELARWSAAWRAHGPVIISVAVVAQPSRRALRPAAVAACVDPMRSADRIRSRSSLLWPSACASEVTLRR